MPLADKVAGGFTDAPLLMTHHIRSEQIVTVINLSSIICKLMYVTEERNII